MAFRQINLLLGSLLLVALICAPVHACFGPKLFVAAGQSVQEEALFALVTLYVQEKTGVESTRVEIEAGQEPQSLLVAEKADLAFALNNASGLAVFEMEGLPLLLSGKRPVDELQFTTVLPAVRKLNRLLQPADVEFVVDRIVAGGSAMAIAREFLMERRWI